VRFNSLDAWLEWQSSLNPKTIELGLDRVAGVYRKLQLESSRRVITVAGTNGKGSTVAAYETWLHAMGHSVASYTSPHILRYNERIKINLQEVDDVRLCEAFERVDQVRAEVPLTYFEFGTLAALVLIADEQPDYAILEVGLGGRLDAVNIIDPDLAHITSIALDHQDWLGNDRESIAGEKAGILRQGGQAVYCDHDPAQRVLLALRELDCDAAVLGRDYDYQLGDDDMLDWQGRDTRLRLNSPLAGAHQAQNLAGVLAGLELLGCLDGQSEASIAAGFNGLTVPGRLQPLLTQMDARLLLDVGHNPAAAHAQAVFLAQQDCNRVVVLLGMLGDKDCAAFVSELSPQVDEWWLVDLDVERGLSAVELKQRLAAVPGNYREIGTVADALKLAMSSLGNQDILIATGSFVTVEAVAKHFN
jgi:dihydrofolate synthase/folylpolyglutamate synthase